MSKNINTILETANDLKLANTTLSFYYFNICLSIHVFYSR